MDQNDAAIVTSLAYGAILATPSGAPSRQLSERIIDQIGVVLQDSEFLLTADCPPFNTWARMGAATVGFYDDAHVLQAVVVHKESIIA